MSMMMMMKMTTEACLSADFFLCAGLPGKHARICDLVNVLSLPLLDRKGDFFAFSGIKKSSMFESGRVAKKQKLASQCLLILCMTPACLCFLSVFAEGGWRKV